MLEEHRAGARTALTPRRARHGAARLATFGRSCQPCRHTTIRVRNGSRIDDGTYRFAPRARVDDAPPPRGRTANASARSARFRVAFRFLDGNARTLAEIGDEMHLSRERVRQLIDRGVDSFRRPDADHPAVVRLAMLVAESLRPGEL